ncbi:hypothetical protein IFM89_021874 [Coptis chinensis]|uniref:Uncharacterized protein n=1 Tax=Coptis chinensis TaxID=261450 RepID=A0A835LND7_9MAGN|nr:hypothetical protein IFM89_021874 [Coptis chinensis]
MGQYREYYRRRKNALTGDRIQHDHGTPQEGPTNVKGPSQLHSQREYIPGNQELLGQDPKICPDEGNVEAMSVFSTPLASKLDESPKFRRVNDAYFNRMKELTTHPQLAQQLKFMVRGVLDLRANKWVPSRKEVYVEKISVFISRPAQSKATFYFTTLMI